MKLVLLIASVLAWANAGYTNEEITVELPGGAMMEFVWIEPGTFMMESQDADDMAYEAEKPRHQVTISKGFYLGKYEITQEQWMSVIGSIPGRKKGAQLPVVWFSWKAAQSFIHRLNEAAGDSLYRLPTEAEWEYACRAGSEALWTSGDDESALRDYAWYSGNDNPHGTKDVGTRLPNAWGLYDMHGNVLEWCQDWHGPYSSENQIDPAGPATGTKRVVRGAYFNSHARDVRSARRFLEEPHERRFFLGARLVWMQPESTSISPDGWGQIKANQ